jgi:hypothetical protein
MSSLVSLRKAAFLCGVLELSAALIYWRHSTYGPPPQVGMCVTITQSSPAVGETQGAPCPSQGISVSSLTPQNAMSRDAIAYGTFVAKINGVEVVVSDGNCP